MLNPCLLQSRNHYRIVGIVLSLSFLHFWIKSSRKESRPVQSRTSLAFGKVRELRLRLWVKLQTRALSYNEGLANKLWAFAAR